MALEAYDRLLGLKLVGLSVGCWITKAPCGGEKAGRSPVDLGKRGIKRSIAVAPPATSPSRSSSPRLNGMTRRSWPATLNPSQRLRGLPDRARVHLDHDHDSRATREKLTTRRLRAEISEKGKPAPVLAPNGGW